MASWDKKDKAWYASIYPNGKRKRVKLRGITSKKAADRKENVLRLQITMGEYTDPKKMKPAKLASELLPLYIKNWSKVNNKGYLQDEHNIQKFIDVVGDKRIDEYNTLDVDRFKQERKKSIKNLSVNRELCTISGFFSKMYEWGELREKKIKFRKISVPYDESHRDRIPNPNELRAIFDSIRNPEFFLIVEILCMTGLRRADAVNLTVEKVLFDADVIQFKLTQSKTGKRVTIFLHPRLKADLKRWIENNNIKSGRLFSMSVRDVSENFTVLCKLLNISNLKLHDLRHVFGTTLAATRVNGISIDPFALSTLMGHTDVEMTKRYINPLDEYKRQFIDNMPTKFLPPEMPK